MFYDRACNQMINKLHERALKIVYDYYCSIFVELLDNNQSITIRNLRALAITMYRISNGLSHIFMVEIINELSNLTYLINCTTNMTKYN